MKNLTRAAAAAAAMLSLAAGDARAQLIELPATAGAAGDLTAHQIRVVQLALRDNQCYQGMINGRWTAATRSALQCAQQRTSAADPDALARALALWSADAMTSRDMAGDVETTPAAPTPAPAATPATPTPMATPMRDSATMRDSAMMRDSSMATPMRDSSMVTPTPMRDSTPTPTPMRDSMATPTPMPAPTPTPMRDSSATPTAPRDSTVMPMTPTDPLSPMSRTGTTSAMVDSVRAARSDSTVTADPAASTGGGMLVTQVDSVIAAAESGLTSMEPAQAATLLGNIATQLDAANDPALGSIATDLRSLRTQLTATPFDAATVGRSLTSVSDKVETAAAGLTGDAQTKLMRLATLLETSGRQLAPPQD